MTLQETNIIQTDVVSCRAVSCRAVPCRVRSCRVMPTVPRCAAVLSCSVPSHPVMSCHVICHVVHHALLHAHVCVYLSLSIYIYIYHISCVAICICIYVYVYVYISICITSQQHGGRLSIPLGSGPLCCLSWFTVDYSKDAKLLLFCKDLDDPGAEKFGGSRVVSKLFSLSLSQASRARRHQYY